MQTLIIIWIIGAIVTLLFDIFCVNSNTKEFNLKHVLIWLLLILFGILLQVIVYLELASYGLGKLENFKFKNPFYKGK